LVTGKILTILVVVSLNNQFNILEDGFAILHQNEKTTYRKAGNQSIIDQYKSCHSYFGVNKLLTIYYCV